METGGFVLAAALAVTWLAGATLTWWNLRRQDQLVRDLYRLAKQPAEREATPRGVDEFPPDAFPRDASRKTETPCFAPSAALEITPRAAASVAVPETTRVRDVMTPEAVYCFEEDDVREAARVMAEKQVRRLVVLNRDKRFVGVVSLGDLAVQTGGRAPEGKALGDLSRQR
jgi:hypothetical protein